MGYATTPSETRVALKALLASDIVSSTRLVEELGDVRGAQLFARHDEGARALLARHQGREMERSDGLRCIFERPLDAVVYALAYHRLLAEISREFNVALSARVGIHLGELLFRMTSAEEIEVGAKAEQIEGLAISLCARVMGLALGGQTLLTRGAFDLARRADVGRDQGDKVPRWLAHGPYRLRGIEDPVEVFEVGYESEAPLAVPPDQEKAKRAVTPGEEETLGWRPAKGDEVPGRPNWVLHDKLGEGGFGEVWLVRQTKSGAERVFKFCFQGDRLRALKREVVLFRLIRESLGDRDDIARIIDWKFDEPPFYIESEYVSGGTLGEWIDARGGAEAVPLEERLLVMRKIAAALAAAHSVGILHKDVKPSNILVLQQPSGEPRVRLMDFGIGLITNKELLGQKGITDTGLTATHLEGNESSRTGTRLYMAPELLAKKPPSIQSDLFALGVLLYQMVTGRFGEAVASGWERHVADPLLREDIARCVAGEPERRLGSATELAERLATLDERRRALRRRRAGQLTAALSAVLAVISVATIGIANRETRLRVAAEESRQREQVARGTAEGIIEFMLFDMRDKLSEEGRLFLLEDVAKRSLDYFDEIPPAKQTPEDLRKRATAIDNGALVLVSRGNIDEALAAFNKSLAIREGLVRDLPGDPVPKSHMVASLSGIAQTQRDHGKIAEAKATLRRAIAISEELLAEDPGNKSHLEKLLQLSNPLLVILEHEGSIGEAMELNARLFEELDEALKASPEEYYFNSMAVQLRNKKARLLTERKLYDEAVAAFEDTLERALAFLQKSPDYVGAQFSNLGVRDSYSNLLANLGDAEKAHAVISPAVDIARAMHERDPEHVQFPVYLAQMLRRRGLVETALGRLDDAVATLGEGEAVVRALHTRRPEIVSVKDALGSILFRLGDAMRKNGDEAGGVAKIEEAVGLLMPLAETGNARHQREFVCHALMLLGRDDEARPWVAELAKDDYGNEDFKVLARERGLWGSE